MAQALGETVQQPLRTLHPDFLTSRATLKGKESALTRKLVRNRHSRIVHSNPESGRAPRELMNGEDVIYLPSFIHQLKISNNVERTQWTIGQ